MKGFNLHGEPFNFETQAHGNSRKWHDVLFLPLAFNDIDDMIDALSRVKNPDVDGLLLDRHVAVASLQTLKNNTLEIGRLVDYDYYIGMSVRPPQNATQICEMVNKCAVELVHSEGFELATLKVSWRKLRNTGSIIPVVTRSALSMLRLLEAD